MRIACVLGILTFLCYASSAQTPADKALLEKTRALYDTPFTQGLINFDCAVGFDFEQHLTDSYGSLPPMAVPMVKLLQPIRYRVFVDRSGAVVSPEGKLPDLSGTPHATELEESNRGLLQMGLTTWVPYASGILFPLGPTKFHFEKVADGYTLSMSGNNLSAQLTLNNQLHMTSGLVEKPMYIETASEFEPGTNGLVLAAGSTNTNHMGIARYRFTYQALDGFQVPSSISISSEQNMTWNYKLTDCKASHGQVVHVQRPKP